MESRNGYSKHENAAPVNHCNGPADGAIANDAGTFTWAGYVAPICGIYSPNRPSRSLHIGGAGRLGLDAGKIHIGAMTEDFLDALDLENLNCHINLVGMASAGFADITTERKELEEWLESIGSRIDEREAK